VSSPWPPGAWTTPSRLMKALRTMCITHALSVLSVLSHRTCYADPPRARNSSALNTLQFGLDDLASMLPN
jgi:hypothetical protein